MGASTAWPAGVKAQSGERPKRIAVLMDAPRNERSRPRLAAFVQGLMDLGWSEHGNMQMEIRWGANTPDTSRQFAAELLGFGPDVFLVSGSSATAALRQATSRIPIVFTLVTDPVGAGFVESLSRPGGNVTGFTLFEYSISGKWLELLKELAPNIKRVGVLRDTDVAAGSGQFGALQAVAPSAGVELRPLSVNDREQIERGISSFAPGANDGLIVTATPLAAVHREQLIALAARYRLPSVFAYRHFVAAGGLASYGPDLTDPFRRAASYVSRVLRNEKIADLPVQAPTAYELAINLRTAAALGLTVSPTLIARADEVIE